jgi:hypothetical protein
VILVSFFTCPYIGGSESSGVRHRNDRTCQNREHAVPNDGFLQETYLAHKSLETAAIPDKLRTNDLGKYVIWYSLCASSRPVLVAWALQG